KEAVSLLRRIKRAFFIVIAAASTTLATMLPIILFGYVLVKIVGFAIAITIGVLVGVFVTRPAYGEIARIIVSKY
ncbi:MAG: protein translocase subunit SecD, partial [Candidatus Diapherotrites archaeon]|nr:protein translocase subunit SecD [Candidatus Diapherotrites archaeon]